MLILSKQSDIAEIPLIEFQKFREPRPGIEPGTSGPTAQHVTTELFRYMIISSYQPKIKDMTDNARDAVFNFIIGMPNFGLLPVT